MAEGFGCRVEPTAHYPARARTAVATLDGTVFVVRGGKPRPPKHVSPRTTLHATLRLVPPGWLHPHAIALCLAAHAHSAMRAVGPAQARGRRQSRRGRWIST